MSKNFLFENISREELSDNLKKLYSYMKKRLPRINKDPRVFFKEDEINADDLLGKTGYYDPQSYEIHLYVTNRHAKDILRSFAHELIHHEQNCCGITSKLDMSKTNQEDYALHDKELRNVERDAFTRGNMFFRDWTDKLKTKRHKETKIMNERKKNKKKHPNKIEDAKKAGKEAARQWLDHDQGKDLERMKKDPQQENADVTTKTPYPELFEKKERVLQDAFNKREELIFQELMKRITTEEK